MKKLLAGIVAMVGVAAFADAANTLVYFYSQGPDTYADGTTVLDGERYALVWSQDGEFDGFTVTGEAVNQDSTKEKVFGIVSRARGGRCPMTVFQIDSKEAPTEGVYAVYLLDTRVAGEDGAELSPMVNGKPQVVKATSTTVATYAVKSDGSFGGATQKRAQTTASAGDVTPIAPGASAAPVVTGIKVEGAYVYITVKNTSPFLTYDVVGAEDVAGVDKGAKKDVQQQAGAPNTDEEITFVVPKENSGKFFKVRRN